MAYPKISAFLPLLTLCANDLISADEKVIEDYRRKFRYLSKISQRECDVDVGILMIAGILRTFHGEPFSEQLPLDRKETLINLIIKNQIK